MQKKILLLFLILKLLPLTSVGQQFFRIKADFSIKEKLANGQSQLMMGSVFYDRTSNKIVYKIKFPKPETWIIQDTSINKLSGGKLLSKQRSFFDPKQSIFHHALMGQLANYGLKNSVYNVVNVEKEGNKIVTTWLPDAALKKKLGKIKLAQQNKELFGLVFYSPLNEVLSKQFFTKYANIKGCNFPSKITQITYLKTGANFQETTYKNIIIDAPNEDDIYNSLIPK
jgi:hypothetical protein